MSRQHRSLKLINRSVNSGGKLSLYTELDHTFKINDLVWITGGFYDNVDSILYTDISVSQPNPYKLKPYKIIGINLSINEITIDYNVTTLINPYCSKSVISNFIGSPTDSDMAYNTIMVTPPDMYKNVYISQANFPKPRMVKGVINNGIFGTDKTQVYLSKKTTNGGTAANILDINIKHIAAKNIYSEYCTINAKGVGLNLNTIKLDLNDTLFPINLTVGNDNDGQGYSSFEQCKLISSVNGGIYVEKSKIENQRTGYIQLTNVLVNNAEIGSRYSIELDANRLYLCSLNDISYLNQVSFRSTNKIYGNVYASTNLSLVGTVQSYNSATKEITFNNVSNKFINKCTLYNSVASTGFISGFCNSNTKKPIDYLNGKISITSKSYTYGSNSSGIITIKFFNLLDASKEADFVSTYIDGSLHLINTNIDNINIYYNQATELNSSIIIDANLINTTSNNCNISTDTFMRLTGGHYVDSVISGPVDGQYATSYNLPIYLYNVKQFTKDGLVPIFNYTIIDSHYTYNMILSYGDIKSGNFSNSEFYNTTIKYYTFQNVSTNDKVFLYNSKIKDYCIVDNNIEWEYINFNCSVLPSYISNVYTTPTIFQGRTKPFYTGDSLNAPLNINSFAWNLNNKKTNNPGVYASGNDTVTSRSVSNNLYVKPYVKQNTYGSDVTLPSYNNAKTYSIYDLGEFTYVPTNYTANNSTNRLFIAEKPLHNSSLNTAITNITFPHPLGTNDTYMQVDDLLNYTVDGNYLYKHVDFYKSDFKVIRKNTMVSVQENPTVPTGFPTATTFTYDIIATGPGTTQSGLLPYDGTTGTVYLAVQDKYLIRVNSYGWTNPPTNTVAATKIPKCYIEVENVRTEYWSGVPSGTPAPMVSNGIEFSNLIIGTGTNNDNSYVPTFPVSNILNSKLDLSLYSVSSYCKIIISFWVTEYETTTGSGVNHFNNCGKRYRVEQALWFHK